MEGGREALTLVADHQGLVRSYFARRRARREDVEDLAQETFCAILASYPRSRKDPASDPRAR